MTTDQWLAQPNKVFEDEDVHVTFKPIFDHPHMGWEIVNVVHRCPVCGSKCVTTNRDGSHSCGGCAVASYDRARS